MTSSRRYYEQERRRERDREREEETRRETGEKNATRLEACKITNRGGGREGGGWGELEEVWRGRWAAST